MVWSSGKQIRSEEFSLKVRGSNSYNDNIGGVYPCHSRLEWEISYIQCGVETPGQRPKKKTSPI